jgi:hypothetical protein
VKPCPEGFTPGYYWYGGRRRGPGCSPRWFEAESTPSAEQDSESSLPSLSDGSQTDALPSEPGPSAAEEPGEAGETEEILSDSEDMENCPDVIKAVEDGSPQTLYSQVTTP